MRVVTIVILGILSHASCGSKSNTKALTELGQEVIEIAQSVKDLPPELEEEPSGEVYDKGTTTTLGAATAKDARRQTAMDARRKMKDEKLSKAKQEDEEARIEKELAEMYKDTDYKADSAEVTQKETSQTPAVEKAIERSGANFDFEPAGNSQREVERFRTSIDEISCAKNKLISATESPNSANNHRVIGLFNMIMWTAVAII